MAEKTTKARDESIKELVAQGAEALAAKVLDLQGEVDKLAADNEGVTKLRAQHGELKRVVKAQAEELKAAGILSPSASPIVLVGERYARVKGDAIIDGKKCTAEEIAASPELLKKLADKNSGLLQFSDDVVKAAEEKKNKQRETTETK